MINHIDLSSVLRRTECGLFSNLVTRPTGAAVRAEIEFQLQGIGDRSITVIDFTNVGLLDLSCADEIVCKLLLRYAPRDEPAGSADIGVPTGGGDAADAANAADAASVTAATATAVLPENYFFLRGVHEHHLDAIEHVLERHRLALVAELEGGEAQLVGVVDAPQRALWDALCRRGPADVEELSRETGLDPAEARRELDALCHRRLAMPIGDGYVAVGVAR